MIDRKPARQAGLVRGAANYRGPVAGSAALGGGGRLGGLATASAED